MQEYTRLGEAKDTLEALMNHLNDRSMIEAEAMQALWKSELAHAETLKNKKIKDQQSIFEEMKRLGLSNEEIFNQQERANNLKRAQEERDQKLKNAQSSADAEAIELEYANKWAEEEALLAKVNKARETAEKKQQQKRLKDAEAVASKMVPTKAFDLLFKKAQYQEEAIAATIEELSEDPNFQQLSPEAQRQKAEDMVKQAEKQATQKALSNLADKLASQGAQIADAQTAIDTRLQGLTTQRTWMGSYWQAINQDIGAAVGVSPFVKQETVVEKLKAMVGQGIAFNVEQRAFLAAISDKIATTFDAADGTLLKLVRIQQADTTAARLGMESALTAFLNNMYETSEYMQQAATDIRNNIYEASALMAAQEATEFEYQTQKWMGSLYSVGFSNTSGLSQAFGKLAAGDISGITDGGYGNLLIMAANAAGLAVSDILAQGLDSTNTNRLFEEMVRYLAGLYEETKESKVVAQQVANVYGLTASDLKAAANLSSSLQDVTTINLNYGGMLQQLSTMSNTMYQRTSVAGMTKNVMDNFMYTMAEGLGNNPILYATYQIADLLDDVAGGINIPAITAVGSGINLMANVSDLMKIGAMSGSVLQGIGKLVTSLGSAGGFSGAGMLSMMGVDLGGGPDVTTRGAGTGLLTLKSGQDVSTSGFIGNASSEDVQNKTMADANDSANNQLAEAKAQEDEDIKLRQVDSHVVEIYQLLLDVTTGTRQLRVEIGDIPSVWS